MSDKNPLVSDALNVIFEMKYTLEYGYNDVHYFFGAQSTYWLTALISFNQSYDSNFQFDDEVLLKLFMF